MKILSGSSFLRIFLGIIFLSAGLFRIFNWNSVIAEFSALGLNYAVLAVIVVAIEIIAGIMLIFNVNTKKALLLLIIFLFIALFQALAINWKEILDGSRDLFFFNPNSTDFFLHITYLIILGYLFLNSN